MDYNRTITDIYVVMTYALDHKRLPSVREKLREKIGIGVVSGNI